MKNILVTGGTNGLGKGIALELLKNNNQVIVVGSSNENGKKFLSEAKDLGAKKRAYFIQGNLSLLEDNKRIIEEIKKLFDSLNIVIFCAEKHNLEYTETSEGIESSFALSYLSRFLLSYGLKELLEKSAEPMILNFCGSGMKGEPNWLDLQHKESFMPQKVMMHGSRLNDLLGVQFAKNDTVHKIKYIMYNPWAVKTPGMMEFFKNPLMKFIYKIIGKTVDKAVVPVMKIINNPPSATFSAYREDKVLDLNHSSYNIENAQRLYDITIKFLNEHF